MYSLTEFKWPGLWDQTDNNNNIIIIITLRASWLRRSVYNRSCLFVWVAEL